MTGYGLLMLLVLQFEMDFNHPVESHIKFEYVEDDTHAMCIHATNEIRINLFHWDKLPLMHKRELVYHELGHCEFQLRHTEDAGIMRILQYSSNGRNWNKLVKDMKKMVRDKHDR